MGNSRGGDIGFVHRRAANAVAQAVLVDLDLRLLGKFELGSELCAVGADARHGQLALDLVVVTQAREIHVQVIFEIAYHHLENAGEVLAFGDGVGRLLQQTQAAELLECPELGKFARGRLGAQSGIRRFQIRGSRANPIFQRFVEPGEVQLRTHSARRVDRAHLRQREQQEEPVRKPGGVRQHRGSIGRRLGVEHGDVADDGEYREQRDDPSEALGSAHAPVEDADGEREERHQHQRRPGDAEPGRRRVRRDGVEEEKHSRRR